ncbi:hypothetical protein QSV37_17570 [Acinetobacter sp. VNK23]|uniref:hypothetical protein n=1 Tax=Acinetobacter thutiue TaxID=2998078 RepID=UPI002575CFD3|nr:hypothetical protein [Acinetobacter thutiue]MDM1022084.1 hypothetical protein [Acinetobacter thutiue]
MKPRNIDFTLFAKTEDGFQAIPIGSVEINVNGGYTFWNRWEEPSLVPSHFLGIDLDRPATKARNQAINRLTIPGTLISQIIGKTYG